MSRQVLGGPSFESIGESIPPDLISFGPDTILVLLMMTVFQNVILKNGKKHKLLNM